MAGSVVNEKEGSEPERRAQHRLDGALEKSEQRHITVGLNSRSEQMADHH